MQIKCASLLQVLYLQCSALHIISYHSNSCAILRSLFVIKGFCSPPGVSSRDDAVVPSISHVCPWLVGSSAGRSVLASSACLVASSSCSECSKCFSWLIEAKCRRRLLSSHHASRASKARAMTPPTTPPAMAPVLFLCETGLVLVPFSPNKLDSAGSCQPCVGCFCPLKTKH